MIIHFSRRRALAVAAAAMAFLMAAAPASALNWRVAAGKSQITVTYIEDGAAERGAFSQFRGTGAFDPARPGAARLTLTIDVASLTLKDRFRSDFVKGPVWFDASRRPQATFELDGLEPVGGDRYRASGSLQIKDTTRRVTLPVDIRISDREAVASGVLRFNRFDFNVGDRSSLFVDIGDDIAVAFQITAERI